MLNMDEARSLMLAAVSTLEAEIAPLSEAMGRTPAIPVTATRDHPPYSASAMDGYAVRSMDTPVQLSVVGEARAGHGYAGKCEAGMAILISTWPVMPEAANTVVAQEDVRRGGMLVEVPNVRPGRNIRSRALDFLAGTVLLGAARKLDGIVLAVAAASGTASFSVIREPRIAIQSGGDELVEPGVSPDAFQVFDSASYGIVGLIRTWGALPRRIHLEKNDVAAIANAVERGMRESDVLVIIGGPSVGDRDEAREALKRLGLHLLVAEVAVRPRKLTWFSITLRCNVIGLPSNPASAIICAHLFLRPLIEKMLGRNPLACVRLHRARLANALPGNGPLEHYVSARLTVDTDGRLAAQACKSQNLPTISMLASTNALIRRLPAAPALLNGAMVDALLLHDDP